MVIKQVKHWMKLRAHASHWKPVADWAAKRGAQFTIEDEDGAEGFSVVEAQNPLGPLLLEWGTPQRDYVQGAELRLRWDLKLKSDLQVMVIERSLMDQLEGQVFEAYTDTLQTRIDTDTPEEMRWLVMFPKFNHAASQIVRQRYGLVGVTKELTGAWVEGELGETLAQASQDLLPEGHPFVLMTMRGNIYLRTAMSEAELPRIQALVRLLECAAREAQRVNTRLSDAGPWPSTTAAAWQFTTRPGDA